MKLRPAPLPVYAYRPATTDAAKKPSPKPLTIYLHGICGDPGNGCPYFKDGVTDSSWLLCPSAPTPCPGGGATWSGPTAQVIDTIQRAEARAAGLDPDDVDTTRPRVLVGFSQGGYRVPGLLRAQPGHYRGALVIGADVRLGKKELEAAGVRRLALGAGRYDMTFRAMRDNARALERDGFDVRFVDLGKVGHTYAPEAGNDALREALAWLEAAE